MTYYSELASFFIRVAVNFFVVGIPISVGILIVLKLTRAAPPRARYLLVVTAFTVAAILPIVLTVVPAREIPHHQTIVNGSTTNRADIPGRPLTTDTPAPRMELIQSQPTASVDLMNSLVVFLTEPALSIGLFTLWVVGACVLLGREVASHLRVARTRHQLTPTTASIRERLSWPKDIPLFIDNEFGPCVLGVFDPIVVIPTRVLELSGHAVRQISRHELDHLKWRDPTIHAAMRIVCASFWLSAPLWYLNRVTRLEREAASDRAAVNSTSGGLQPDIAALEYAATLISIARSCARIDGRPKHAWVATEIGNEPGINDRVKRLMSFSTRLTSIRLSFAVATLLICAGSLALLPAARLESKQNENLAEQIPPQQSTFSSQGHVEIGPPKKEVKKSARPATLNASLPETSNGKLGVEDDVWVKTKPTPVIVNKIQPMPFVQLPDLESQMAALGYKDLTAKQLADMRAYAVGPGYVAEMADSGYSGLSADMLILFKWLGVSSSYIREMKTLGYDNLSPRMMVYFRQWGVGSDYIRKMRSRISGSISAEEMGSLRFYGASPEFVDKLNEMGYANLNADQLISMRLQGVSIPFIEALKAQGHQGLTVNELIAMKLRRSH